jgi:hypothetical protein
MALVNRSLLAGLVGLAAGSAAAGGTFIIRRRLRGGPAEPGFDHLEIDVVDALCADEVAGSCAIDVAALGPGLIELTGRVPDQDAAGRAAAVAQRVAGVHTVVNRLVVERVEQQLEETRRRYGAGDPELRASGWEGMSSGMGARRQGAETDPDQADDSRAAIEDAIGVEGRVR